ncbi:MAG: RDD family protein [Chthoniobacter sp.]|nr:RDD family protein [Chthoniobacter sp.]
MNPTLKIRTPEGIAFSFALAGPVVRCLAWAVDFWVILGILKIVVMLGTVVGFLSQDFQTAALMIGYFVVSVGYGIVLEWFWRGRTVGKWLLRLQVMDAHGLRLQPHQVLLRNLLRFVDSLPAFYFVGGVACLLSRKSQRLGDLAGSTVVVYNPKPTEPDLDQLLAGKFNSLRQHPHLEARLRQRVSPNEARLALQALVRRDDLDPAARVALFSELADHFKSVVAFPPEIVEAVPDEQYVRNVVDILFRTRGDMKPSSREVTGAVA